jgi:stage II sporulation protein AB (anti-sigma F factor)
MEGEKMAEYEKERMEFGTNEMQIVFDSKSENEGFARTAVAAFVSCLNPTVDELADIKTAVSEAVTNCIIHGYHLGPGKIFLDAALHGRTLLLSITDEGCGIRDVKQAMQPLFTTCPELERSGMGFSFMEAFMDYLEVESTPGRGTRVMMRKEIG